MSTISKGVIVAYDVATHTATVRLARGLGDAVTIPVNDGINQADVVAGRECGVIFFTDDNPADAAIVTIHNAVPASVLKDSAGTTQLTVTTVGITIAKQLTASGRIVVGGIGTGVGASQLIQAQLQGVQTGNSTLKGGFQFLANPWDLGGYNLTDFYGAQFTPGLEDPTGSGNCSYHAAMAGIVIGANALGGSGGLVDMDGFTILSPIDSSLGASLIQRAAGLRIRDQGFTATTDFSTPTPITALDIEAQSATVANSVRVLGTLVTSIHQPSLQLFGTTKAFGGGVGVLGITNATTNPTSNPSGGVVAWVAAATGHFNMRGAAGQICKLPTGGATNVTGSRGGNVALANVLTALAALGHIVDGTTV